MTVLSHLKNNKMKKQILLLALAAMLLASCDSTDKNKCYNSAEQQQSKHHSISQYTKSSIDTSYYVPKPSNPVREVDSGIVRNGHDILTSVKIAFTPLSGGDIGKADGVR